jgi:EmrB/QacA subfamily drug resistance transporter
MDQSSTAGDRTRWSALVILCLGVFMVVIDVSIVYVALPAIRKDLDLTNASLIWVVNAYTLALSGAQLLAGRLSDLYGHRRLLFIGLVLFTFASLACGFAGTQNMLIAGRTVQGLSGAIVSTVALSLVIHIFPDGQSRSKAMGLYSAVIAGAGSMGLMLGGLLTSALSWHWIFFVNVPIGVVTCVACLRLLPESAIRKTGVRLDVWGTVTITMSITLLTYAVVDGNGAGWSSFQTLATLAAAAILLVLFFFIEARVSAPLVPPEILKIRSLMVSSVVRLLWESGAAAAFFISLYMQIVLGLDPMQVAVALLPANITMAAFSLWFSAKLVTRFGTRLPLCVGMLVGAAALAMFARLRPDSALLDVVPGAILFGLSAGIVSSPLLLSAMRDVTPKESGLASGIVSTIAMLSNALGLAVLVSASSARTSDLLTLGSASAVAETGGYRLVFLIGTACLILAGLLGPILLRDPSRVPPPLAIRINPE